MSFTGNSAPQVKLETQSTDKNGLNKHMKLTCGPIFFYKKMIT